MSAMKTVLTCVALCLAVLPVALLADNITPELNKAVTGSAQLTDAGKKGACGYNVSSCAAAVSWQLFTSGAPWVESNGTYVLNDTVCTGICVKVENNGSSVTVPVQNQCGSCDKTTVGLTPAAFKLLGSSSGSIDNVTITYLQCSGATVSQCSSGADTTAAPATTAAASSGSSAAATTAAASSAVPAETTAAAGSTASSAPESTSAASAGSSAAATTAVASSAAPAETTAAASSAAPAETTAAASSTAPAETTAAASSASSAPAETTAAASTASSAAASSDAATTTAASATTTAKKACKKRK